MADPRDTPAMRQFYGFKKRHPDCVLLFRIGDFYETFDDDAVVLHKALGLTLTRRTEGIPMAGVPHHQLDTYLRRLVGLGIRVAVADQLQDAKDAKGIVARGVTRVVTPGTLVDEPLLDDAGPVRLAALSPAFTPTPEAPARTALAVAELSTGEFVLAEVESRLVADELVRRGVREALVADDAAQTPALPQGVSPTPRPAWHFRAGEAREAILDQFGVATLAGFGLRDDDPALGPAGALLRYLRETQTADQLPSASKRDAPALAHLRPPRREDPADRCVLDSVSLRALEIERTLRGSGAAAGEGTLLGVFLSTQGEPGLTGFRTPMGRRLVREWLVAPLRDPASIRRRHDAVGALAADRSLRERLVRAIDASDEPGAISGVQDVPRIAARIALARATPRDIVALGRSLARAGPIARVVESSAALEPWVDRARLAERTLSGFASRVARECVDDPPPHLREGGLVRPGVDAELDEARSLRAGSGEWLAAYQVRVTNEFALAGARVGYNRVFGYYIELSASRAEALAGTLAGLSGVLSPLQTLKNAHRYTTPELRDFEHRASTAEARAIEREKELLESILGEAGSLLRPLDDFASLAGELDTLAALAAHADRYRWVRPEIVERPVLSIAQGRHPVLERTRPSDLVPNDCSLGEGGGEGGVRGAPLALITGPNMAGKSTYIRQNALIAVLALAGSFVPAERATVGIVDRVFTRIGADDALHAGQSTFMVEMTETANILHHATPRSLVVLDEVGRGTSTLDGLSLAWAIAEHLARDDGPRALFATHYHELTDLAERLPCRVANFHVGVREWGDEIVFLHRILPGRSDRSYGIHVARLAGVPPSVTRRAREVLDSLAVQHVGPAADAIPDPQLGLFTEYLPHPALDALREVKLDRLTPIQAFDELRRLLDLVRSS